MPDMMLRMKNIQATLASITVLSDDSNTKLQILFFMNFLSLSVKVSEISHYVNSHQPLVLIVTETYTTESSEDARLSIHQYTLVRVESHNRHTRGV